MGKAIASTPMGKAALELVRASKREWGTIADSNTYSQEEGFKHLTWIGAIEAQYVFRLSMQGEQERVRLLFRVSGDFSKALDAAIDAHAPPRWKNKKGNWKKWYRVFGKAVKRLFVKPIGL